MTVARFPVKTTIQVVGFGPAAIGIPVAADRLSLFSDLMKEGILFIDSSDSLSSLYKKRFPYVIHSNSVSEHFLESIRKDGVFRSIWDTPNTLFLLKNYGRVVPLAAIKNLMNELTGMLIEACSDFRHSGVVLNQDIVLLKRERDRTFSTYNVRGEKIAVSSKVILATGAREKLMYQLAGSEAGETVMSELVLTGNLHDVEKHIASGSQISIVGGAHSAFSTAEVLLRFFNNSVRPGQIQIYANRVKLYYVSQARALCEGCKFSHADVDPETMEVNRFVGLREDALRLYKKIMAGQEQRVGINSLAFFNESPLALTIQCTGYHPRKIRIINERNQEIELGDQRNLKVNDNCQLLDQYGHVVDDVYCLGIGHARQQCENGPYKVGINIFHGKDSEMILNHMIREKEIEIKSNISIT